MSFFLEDFADLCAEIIVWDPMTGRDAYGKPTYSGSPQTFQGRRTFKRSRIPAGSNGLAVDVIAESEVWILGLPDVKLDDKVYVQGDTTFPPIVQVAKYSDEDGPLYTKVFFGSYVQNAPIGLK